jgi:hypothetical protein
VSLYSGRGGERELTSKSRSEMGVSCLSSPLSFIFISSLLGSGMI